MGEAIIARFGSLEDFTDLPRGEDARRIGVETSNIHLEGQVVAEAAGATGVALQPRPSR